MKAHTKEKERYVGTKKKRRHGAHDTDDTLRKRFSPMFLTRHLLISYPHYPELLPLSALKIQDAQV